MNALLDQFPGDFELTGEHDADTDERLYREVWENEQRLARALSRRDDTICDLHARIAELERRLAGTPPMPPTPDDLTW